MAEKRIIYLATVDGYRPSGFDKCNLVIGGGGSMPHYNAGIREGQSADGIHKGRI